MTLAVARAILVTPLSGPLAIFGRPGARALELWAEQSGVRLDVIDAHPSTAAAISAAEAVRPDVMFGPYGCGPAMVAAGAAAGVLWNHGGATARLARPAYPRVVNVPSVASSYLAAVLEALVFQGLPLSSRVVLVHIDTGFGREVAAGASAAARQLDIPLQPISFRAGGVNDVLGRVPRGDVLLAAGSFEDDVAVARWAGERYWRAVGLVAAGVEELRGAIGERVEGLYGPCQWLADGSDTPTDGPDAAWFVHRYRDWTGSEPPYPAAAAFAAGVIWQRCVQEAGTLDSEPVRAASQRLDTTTLFGRFRVDPVTGLQAGHRVRVVQWRGKQRVAVDQNLS
ncbi:MAG TPA: ABC transporter substrate-binding protein [Mycobacterium sp.]|nr:ABC transporter substrate-binding protein [Mycobacterium sp.]